MARSRSSFGYDSDHSDTKVMPVEERRALPITIRSSDTPQGTVRSMLCQFGSVDELIAARDRVKFAYSGTGSVKSNEGWTTRWSSFRTMLQTGWGDTKHQRAAEAMMRGVARMTADVTARPTWAMAPAGAYPIVPVAIGGDPFSMRVRTMEQDASAPLRVFVPMNCSSAIEEREFADVLTDVLCALLTLSERRPVELFAYGSLNARKAIDGSEAGALFITVPVPFAYQDYKALAIWTDCSVGRTVMMGLTCGLDCGYQGEWPFYDLKASSGGMRYPPSEANTHKLWAEHLGITEDDILIPPLFGKDGIDQVRKRMTDALKASGIELNWGK